MIDEMLWPVRESCRGKGIQVLFFLSCDGGDGLGAFR